MDESQLTFDLFSEPEPDKKRQEETAISKQPGNPAMPIKEIQRAAALWLAHQNPHGIGSRVPTRISRYKANLAAFWSIKSGSRLQVGRTMIVECRSCRDECMAEVVGNHHLLPELYKLKEEREALQQVIIKNEPELKEKDFLFNEYQSWDFSKSKNSAYHKCCRRIDKLEKAVYNGSRFEKIRSAYVADFLYLAVPENELQPCEVADGWGLLYVKENKTVERVKTADNWNCPLANHYHLVQNIAMANTADMLFKQGIFASQNKLFFTKVPKRKRKPE